MALDVVEFPEDIAWLDLSFNDITSISDDILEFPALKMIYLHGNKIRRFADIQKLQQLPNLYSLTLHGNPIENYPNYRYIFVSDYAQRQLHSDILHTVQNWTFNPKQIWHYFEAIRDSFMIGVTDNY